MDSIERKISGAVEAVEPALAGDLPPDWEAVGDEITCPRCGYNLRGLTTARCPECGLTFSWAAVLQAARDRRDWLFEHQWKRRPVRTFLKTTAQTLRPVKFWRSIALTDKPNRGALWFMGASLSVWVALSPLIGAAVTWGLFLPIYALSPPPGMVGARPDAARAFFRFFEQFTWIGWAGIVAAFWEGPATFAYVLWGNTKFLVRLALPFVYLLSVLGSLHIYRETLGRKRIKTVHLLRLAVYSFAPLRLWPWAWILWYVGLEITNWSGRFRGGGSAVALSNLVTVLLLILPAVALIAGCRTYLQLPRGGMLGLASVIIAGLVTYNVHLASMVY